MCPSSCDVPSGGCRVVKRCSAQLVETYGPDGRCLHQEVIIHLLPSHAPNMTMDSFFQPLLSHALGTTRKMNYPSKCSGVILSTYVDAESPAVFRCGIRPFYNQEKHMNAQDLSEKLDNIITTLEAAKTEVDANDTLDFDVARKVNILEEISEEVADYVVDQV